MKNNTWIKNLIYLLLIVALFWGGTMLLSNHFEKVQRSYENNISLIILINLIFFGGIGIILGLDNFILQLKKEGKFRVDVSKLIVLGLPSLILSNPYIWAILMPSAMTFMDSTCLISSIVLGYTFVSSIYKEDLTNE